MWIFDCQGAVIPKPCIVQGSAVLEKDWNARVTGRTASSSLGDPGGAVLEPFRCLLHGHEQRSGKFLINAQPLTNLMPMLLSFLFPS